MYLRSFVSALLLAIGSVLVWGQPDSDRITVAFRDIPLGEAISAIESASRYTFLYDAAGLDLSVKVSLAADNMPLREALDTMLSPVSAGYEINGRQIVLYPASADGDGYRVVTGTVLDTGGQPIPGVAVLTGKAGHGVSADADGRFSIRLGPDEHSFTFSCLGYVDKTVQLSGRKDHITVYLSEDAISLDATVVVGYGTQKKVNLTGAISTVESEELKDRISPTLSHMLQGTVPGLNISTSSGRPGNGASVNIRGINSINGGSPLVLVDGVEGSLDLVNPNDVESISVVKDASSAAIYGARASFGVVLVTTKSGAGSDGKPTVQYSGRFGWKEPTMSTDFETRGYYSVYLNDLFYKSYAGVNYSRYTEEDMYQLWIRRNDTVENPERPWVMIDRRNGRDTYVYYANTDWYHYLYRDTQPVMSHNISFSGGTKKVKYFLSGGYNREEGMLRTDTDVFRKVNFRSRLSFDVNDWINISNNTSFYHSSYTYPGVSGVNSSFVYLPVHALASYPTQNPDGSSIYMTSFSNSGVMDGYTTIVDKGLHKNQDLQDNLSTTTELTLKPWKKLEIKGNFTYMLNSLRSWNRQVNTEYSQYPGVTETLNTGMFENKLTETSNTHQYMQTNVFATYEDTYAEKHHLKAMAGFSWETKYLKDVRAIGYNLLSDTLNDLNLVGQGEDGERRMEVSGGQNEYAIAGFFGRINYDYAGKYLVEVSGRYDGTSRFAGNHRWGFFPSVSAGWRISEEKFFAPVKDWFNNLKVRYSFGQLGNQQVGYYDYVRTIGIGTQSYLFGGTKPAVATISAPVASDLSWEVAQHQNLGVDMAFLGNRLGVTGEFYIRDTKDMLTAGIALPSVYGASSPKMNSADLRTKGYELTISWKDMFMLLGKPFSYNASVIFSDYISEITRFDNPERSFAKNYYEGMRWGEIWGYRIDGYFTSDEEAANWPVDQTAVNDIINASAGAEQGLRAGDLKFKDLDNDGKISIGKDTADDPGDREIIGNSEPRYNYGVNIGFRWCGIDFSVFFQGVGHRDWYPDAGSLLFWGPYARPYTTLIPKDFHSQIWTEENPDAYFPRPRGYVALQGTNRELTAVNDKYLQNAGYCRLKSLTVGYTLPQKWTRKAKIDEVRFYFSGENLATWHNIHSDYIDPEMAIAGAAQRIYPWQKTFMFGIDITF